MLYISIYRTTTANRWVVPCTAFWGFSTASLASAMLHLGTSLTWVCDLHLSQGELYVDFAHNWIMSFISSDNDVNRSHIQNVFLSLHCF